MGQALYRKYRSKSLAEIVGQEHITRTLEQAIQKGRISHAYLFTGPRGVGKTSIARILAHEINNLPYDSDQNHIDIIEIDAASNRRIDEIRDLRDKVYIAPAQAKYKVYIIDEVHMLTREAFNALLKTLEEPPAHAVFILATTEMHKLPATIVSRTQRFAFKPIGHDQAIAHLKHIAEAEKIKIDDEALELIVEHGEGSFRDSISLLDQVAGQGEAVNADIVRGMLGIPPKQTITDLLVQLAGKADISSIMQALAALYDQGFQAAAIAKQLAGLIRERVVNGNYDLAVSATALLTQLLEVPTSHDPERYLEIVLLDAVPTSTSAPLSSSPQTTPKVVKTEPSTTKPAATPAPEPTKHSAASKPKTTAKDSQTPEETSITEAETASPLNHTIGDEPAVLDEASWGQVLSELKKQYNTLYSVARMAEPRFLDGNKLELRFTFAFHQKRLNEAKNHRILSNAIVAVIGTPVEIVCLLDPEAKPGKVSTPARTEAAEPLSAISNIFGGGELLES